jgi:fatty-acyl-CoA synthase
MKGNPYENLDKNPANYVPLSPLSFLERAASVYPNRLALVHGAQRYTWGEVFERCRRFASALASRGIGAGDTVSALLPNIPAMYEAHFGVPMCGAVLNALNTRLDAESIAFMLEHGEAKLLLVDAEFTDLAENALSRVPHRIEVIDVEDVEHSVVGRRLVTTTYERFLADADPDYNWSWPADEWQAITLNYTSGTTGNPKGVVYSHRGAYLNGVGNILVWGMPHHAVYLWTLPMFHCNGWCFPWTMAANAGTNVCLRKVDAPMIFDLIRRHNVTHYCGAPIVHRTLMDAPAELKRGIEHRVLGMVAAAAPPAAMIEGLENMGFGLTHVYGLTEVYGPATVCAKQEEWAALSLAEQASLNARQGVRYHVEEGLGVMDPRTMQPVPADGETIGEIMLRGNITMKGYLKNPTATAEAFAGGWFHSGDLAVMHPDGYVKIKDRSKDIIISGGENISSIEVEDVLCRHPAVKVAAVVALPDPTWGETPCAFIELKPNVTASETEIIAFCRDHMAKFKAPRVVVFGELPKTATGKIQKFVLRERARSIRPINV